MPARECSRTACSRPAVSSLTFVYQDSTAVLGPLSRLSEPHAYDLCQDHASRMTAPRGWDLLRVPGGEEAGDDLVALADALRARPDAAAAGPAPRTPGAPGPSAAAEPTAPPGRSGERESSAARHLHVVRNTHD